MVTETSSSVPVPEKVERSFHLASTPIETPNVDGGYFITDLEADLHDENKNLHGILGKLTQYLVACHPDLLHEIEKMSIFDELVELPDIETGVTFTPALIANALHSPTVLRLLVLF
jgi:hypothetical protein